MTHGTGRGGGSAPPGGAAAPSRRQWLGLVTVSLGVALIVVDITIVNVILAPIIDDLDTTSVQAQWVQESYAISFAALLLVTGRLTDLCGARRVLLAGLAVFGLTSIAAALAPGGGPLVLARFVQGVGGALVLPSSLALVNAHFTGRARGRAFAVWGSTIGAAAAVGPLLGGWLAGLSWRWAFGMNVPVVVLVAFGVLSCLPASPRSEGRVDAPSGVLSAVALGSLAFALIEGRTHGWLLTTAPFEVAGWSWSSGPSPAGVAFLVSGLAVLVFWRRQRALLRHAEEPLTDVRLFAIPSFRNGNVVTLVVGLGEFGILAVLPLWLQFALGHTAFEAGLFLAVIAVGSLLASGASFSTSASPLALVRLGLAAEVLGLVALGLTASVDTGWWVIASCLFGYGIGVGFATAQVTNIALVDVPERSVGQGSGIQGAARELGAALGIAVLTTLFFTAMTSGLRDRLRAQGLPPPEAEGLSSAVTESAGASVPVLAGDLRTAEAGRAAQEAMTAGVEVSGYLCAGLLVLALLATVFVAPKTAAGTARGAPAGVAGAAPDRR
ncbi:MFS transporter [Streptomyces sp. NPDC002490]|uniref:MFS transporter n=1 Tax=Streptomyces sp. NPDC002490 TaxID=3154416 RepID=UPI00331E9765